MDGFGPVQIAIWQIDPQDSYSNSATFLKANLLVPWNGNDLHPPQLPGELPGIPTGHEGDDDDDHYYYYYESCRSAATLDGSQNRSLKEPVN